MSRLALLLILLMATSATAADLPPARSSASATTAFARGEAWMAWPSRPTASSSLSWQEPKDGLVAISLWETKTGKRLREVIVNSDLFCGAAWGPTGALVVMRRVDVDAKTGRAVLVADDLRVWNLADSSPFPPPFASLAPTRREPNWRANISRPSALRYFSDYSVSADGRQIAILVRSAVTRKYTVELFDLHPTDSIARLKHVASLAMGDFEIDQIVLPGGGRTLWVFPVCGLRGEILPNGSSFVWDVQSGRRGGAD